MSDLDSAQAPPDSDTQSSAGRGESSDVPVLIHTLGYCPIADQRLRERRAWVGEVCMYCDTVLPPKFHETPAIPRREKPKVLLSTADTVPGHTITEFHGLVAIAEATMHSFVGGEAFAGFAIDNVLGGGFHEAVESVGGNAAVAIRITQMSDRIVAYGTAVTVQSDTQQEDQPPPNLPMPD